MKALATTAALAGAPAGGGTRERILDAAEVLFAERGFAGVAMRELAAAVDLNPASLYNHFASKQVLYEAVLERGLRPLFELLEGLEPATWAPEHLDASTDAVMTHLARQPHVPRLLVQEALGGGDHLAQLAERWLRPLYERALETFQHRWARDAGALRSWEESELPLLLMAFHHVVLGYFALAPLLREVLDEDPLAPGAVGRQRRLVRKIVRLLIVGGERASG